MEVLTFADGAWSLLKEVRAGEGGKGGREREGFWLFDDSDCASLLSL